MQALVGVGHQHIVDGLCTCDSDVGRTVSMTLPRIRNCKFPLPNVKSSFNTCASLPPSQLVYFLQSWLSNCTKGLPSSPRLGNGTFLLPALCRSSTTSRTWEISSVQSCQAMSLPDIVEGGASTPCISVVSRHRSFSCALLLGSQ